MTLIPFSHFDIVLTSLYMRISPTWLWILKEDISDVFPQKWAYAQQNVQFLHDFTIASNKIR